MSKQKLTDKQTDRQNTNLWVQADRSALEVSGEPSVPLKDVSILKYVQACNTMCEHL